MRLRPRIAFALMVLMVLLGGGVAARAAELFYMDHDALTGKYIGPVGPLVLSGEIAPGDYDNLLAKILDDEQRFMSLNKVILASRDGDVGEAMRIARLLKALDSQVTAGPLTGVCTRACFLIFGTASERATDGGHLLGVGRPAGEAPEARDAEADGAVRNFLQVNGVPAFLIEAWFRQGRGEVYWLSAADEENLKSRSPDFEKILVTMCGWDDDVERAAGSGRRPLADLKPMWECRDRVTHADAHKALAAALKERDARSH